MNKHKAIFLTILLILVIIGNIWIVSSLYSYSFDLAEKLSAEKEKTTNLSSEIGELETKNSELNITIKELTTQIKNKEIEINNLFSIVAIQYAYTLNKTSYHLTMVWYDKNKDIFVRNYKINGALFHLEQIMHLVEHAYWLVKPYSNSSEFFKLLSEIICNSTFGDMVSALQLVYGHIYAFKVPLGSHKIDTDLLQYSKAYISRIAEILAKIKTNGTAPQEQLTQKEYLDLQQCFKDLNNVVKEYLSKPGAMIS